LVKPQTEEDKYSIRYAEFVIPMINAIQEQQQQIEKLKEENNALQHTIEQMQALEERIKLLEMKK
jgi:predicted KAP-like P-loop ATPase